MKCIGCKSEINIDFTKVPKDIQSFDVRCKNCGAFIKIGNPFYENPIIKYFSSSLSDLETITIFKDMICYKKDDSKTNTEEPKKFEIQIEDKFFVDSIVLGTAYMPLKAKMMEPYNNVKAMNIKEIHRPKNSSKRCLQIADKDFVADIDMFVEEYGKVFNEFIEIVKAIIIKRIESGI